MTIDLASLRRLAQATLEHGCRCEFNQSVSPDVLLALVAEVERLTASLKRYGKHDFSCPMHPNEPKFYRKLGCKCGLDVPLTGGA